MGKDKEPVLAETKKPAASTSQGQPAQAEHKTSTSSPKGGSAGVKLGCHARGCKDKDVRFNFCEEHFRQFKFGLVCKTGEPVLDYEKKLEHYQKWKQAQRVA